MTTDLLTRSDARLWAPKDRQILDDVTRREFIAGLAAAGLLAACGDGDDPPARSTSPEGRTFTDDAGREVRMPGPGARIAGVHDGVAARALAAGVPLVAIGTRGGSISPEITELYDTSGLELLSDPYELRVEAIAATEPDLILHEASNRQARAARRPTQ